MENKQQTAVEWFIEELEYKGDLRETPSIRNIQLNIDTSDYMELKVQAKEMEKEQKSIKLPSDEEIDEKAFQVPYDNTKDFYDLQFIKGAKWMRDKIRGNE